MEAIYQIFRQYLGRDPYPAELTGFGQAIQRGVLDPTGLAMFIQSTSEYQQRMAPERVSQYAQYLGGADEQMLGKAFDVAQGRFRQLGRPESSGARAQYLGEARNLAGQRSQQLGDYYQQLMQPSQVGSQVYGQMRQEGEAEKQRQWDQYMWSLQRQMAEAERAANMKQAKQNQWMGLAGSAIGAAGSLGGGWLAGRGMGALGSAIGSTLGSLHSSGKVRQPVGGEYTSYFRDPGEQYSAQRYSEPSEYTNYNKPSGFVDYTDVLGSYKKRNPVYADWR